MAVFRFFKMAAVRHLIFVLRVWTTHKEYLLVLVTVQNLVGICALCSSFDNMPVMFCEFGLKMPIHAPFLDSCWGI